MGRDYIEIILAIEERPDIRIPDEDASRVETLWDLKELVAARVRATPRSGRTLGLGPEICRDPNDREIWSEVCRIVGLQSGLLPESLCPEHRIRNDLGIE